MERKEFLENAKNQIRGSLHEGYLYTEIESILNLIEKYNESIHVLSYQYVPMFNDNRHIELIDKMNESHGNIFIDKDRVNFVLKMDSYDLKVNIDTICDFYKKDIDFKQYLEIYDDNPDELQVYNKIPNEHKVQFGDSKYIISKNLSINQILKNINNSINASITEFDPYLNKFITTNFEYGTMGVGKTALSIGVSTDDFVTSFTSSSIKTPNNSIKCVANKAYGYTVLFGLENYISKLYNHNFKELGCEDIAFRKKINFKAKGDSENLNQISLLDKNDPVLL